MNLIQVLIAESFDVYRLGLQKILDNTPGTALAGMAKTGKELAKKFGESPDATCIISSNIADLNIHEIMQSLRKVHKEVPVIILTHSTDLSHLNQALKAGVKGYLTKNSSAEEIADAIFAVSSGKQVFGNAISQLMAGKYADLAQKKKPTSRNILTSREKEILNFILEGYTSSEIAKILYISPRTVETHRSNLMSKLGVKNTAALVRMAMEKEDFS